VAKNGTRVQANPNESNEQPAIPPDLVIPGLDAPDDPLLDLSEVAELFSVHRNTVSNWIAAKALPAVRLPGGTPKVRRSHVAAIIGVARATV
jgi:excisionase family DNA binding protein